MVKFLVIRFASAEEIQQAIPVFRHLSTNVEDSEVHFLTSGEHASLLENNPHIHRIHSYEGKMRTGLRMLRDISFDYIIDLQNNLQSARVKLSLKRMDFTVKNAAFAGKQKLEERFLDTIRLFMEE